MSSKAIQLDEKDRKILNLLNENEEISQEEIAKKIGLSQPSVATRIKKLKEKGIMQDLTGVNLNKVGMYVAIVTASTTNTSALLKMFHHCPFFLNGFVTSGKENLMMMFAGEDLASLESIIDHRVRANKDVQNAEFIIVLSSSKDLIFPIQMVNRPLKNAPCGIDYKGCEAYKENRCFGCPATNRYKGEFW